MAQKLYELAVQLQGKLDGSLEGAMKSTQGHIKELEERVKAYQERQKDVGPLEAAYARNSSAAQALGKTVLDLKGNLSDVSKYEAQRKATAEVGRAYLNTQHELKALTAAYAQDKTTENRKAMQAAAKEAKSLEKAYSKNKTSLQKMEQGLSKAGVNTRNLSGEQKRLSEELSQATRRQEEFNAKAERTASLKAHWEGLTAKVSKYGRAAWQAAKWTAGIATALGYGAFRITKSTAEAGDQAAKLGKKVRMSAEDVQKLQSVANLSGVKNFSGALSTMTKNTDMAVKKQGDAVKSFKELGIKPGDFAKGGAAKGLLVLSERLQKINDLSKQTRILKGLFGDQWGEMAEMLRQGPEAIAKGMKEAEERGILSNDSAAKSEEFLDNITRMQEAVNGLKITIGDELRPVVNDIVLAITDWISKNKALISEKVRQWMETIRENLPKIRDNIFWLAEKLGVLLDLFASGVDKIGGFKTAMSVLAAYLGGKSVLGTISNTTKMLSGLVNAYNMAKGISSAGLPGVGGAGAGVGGGLLGKLTQALGPLALGIGALKVAHDGMYELGGGEKVQHEKIENMKDYMAFNDGGSGMGSADMWSFGTMPTSPPEVKTPPPVETKVENPDVRAEGVPEVKVTVKVDAEAVNRSIAQHARGGLRSTPTLTTIAERGEEEVVPLGEADRGLGLARLMEAARKLRVPMLGGGALQSQIPALPEPPALNASQGQQVPPAFARDIQMPEITYSPVFHITGDDAQEILRRVEEQNRRSFGEMMRDFMDEMERVAYGTT